MTNYYSIQQLTPMGDSKQAYHVQGYILLKHSKTQNTEIMSNNQKNMNNNNIKKEAVKQIKSSEQVSYRRRASVLAGGTRIPQELCPPSDAGTAVPFQDCQRLWKPIEPPCCCLLYGTFVLHAMTPSFPGLCQDAGQGEHMDL